MHLHWDGNNTSLDERNLSAALGAGVTPVTVDYAAIQRVHDWILTLPPPRFPFPVDAARSARGKAIFDTQCAQCHSFTGSKTGTVEDIASIGTDPYRLNSFTYTLATSQALLFPDNVHRFQHFAKTNGYANVPLDGIWARAPYLHNGSVPTLADLLNRPRTGRRHSRADMTFTTSTRWASCPTPRQRAPRDRLTTRQFQEMETADIFTAPISQAIRNRICLSI